MIVLVTNVISALMRSAPDRRIVDWLDDQQPTSIYTTGISVFEIQYGLRILPDGKKRDSLAEAFAMISRQWLSARVLPLDEPSAREAARIAAERRRTGQPVEIRDLLIAGIVAAKQATLATGNTRHFSDSGIVLIDPWSSRSS